MEIIQSFFGAVISLAVFVMVAVGIMKVMQIATDVRGMKDALLEIKRTTQVTSGPRAAQPVAPPPLGPISPEELVRAVHAQSFKDDEFPALDENLPPRS